MKPGKPPVKDDHREWDRIKREIALYKKSVVKVGVLEGTKRDDGVMLAEIAAVHEYGSPKRKIPQRSFLRSWVIKANNEILSMIKRLYGIVLDGKSNAILSLKRLGQFGVDGVRQRITDIQSPPLKEKTIKRKKSSKPLIDSGQLRGSINYDIEHRGLF